MTIAAGEMDSEMTAGRAFACEGWQQLAGLIWLSLLGAFAAMLQPVFLGALADQFAFDSRQLGFLGGAELGGAGLASLVAIYWFPRANLRKVALIALCVAIAGNVVTGWVSQYSLLLLLRFVVGFLGAGVIYALSLGLIGQTRDPDRMVAFAVILQIAALSVAMLCMPELLARWQLPGMMFTIALVLSSGLFVLPLLPQHSVQSGGGKMPILSASSVGLIPIGLLAGMVLFSVGLSGLWAFMERIGHHAGFAASDIGGMLAIGGLIGGLGALVAAILGQRFGRFVPLTFTITGLVGVSLLLGMASDRTGYLIGVSLFNFFWNMTLPYLMGAIAQADRSGRFMVLIPAAQGAGYAVGPVLSGRFILEGGYASAGWVSASVFILCLVLLVPLLLKLQASATPGYSFGKQKEAH